MYKAALNGEVNGFSAPAGFELLQDVSDVDFDGSFADAENRSNLFVALANGNGAQHFNFAAGQFAVSCYCRITTSTIGWNSAWTATGSRSRGAPAPA